MGKMALCDLSKNIPDDFMVSIDTFKLSWIPHAVYLGNNKAGQALGQVYLGMFLSVTMLRSRFRKQNLYITQFFHMQLIH